MSGLGYKAFAAGEVLLASDLQGYAVDQSTMVFASSADRTTKLVAPAKGMVSFLSDDGRVEVYDGSAWKIAYLPPTSYIPTATSYTRSSGSLYYSVAGHTMFISGKIVVSAVSGAISFTAPTGFTYNTNALNGNNVGFSSAGGAQGILRSASTWNGSIILEVLNVAGTYTVNNATSSTVPKTWTSGDSFTVSAMLSLG